MSSRSLHNAAGFTLLEVLITMLILGIVLLLGIPAMHSMLMRSELNQTGRQIEILVQQGRREAVKREARVQVSADTRSVTGFVDVDADGVRDPGDELLGSVNLPARVDWVDPNVDLALLPNGSAATLGSYGLGNPQGDTLRVRVTSLATCNVEFERSW